ncbi:MAG TPA: GGDEF domain-containing protein, partial [bacterium]|nr:GGDEF domain-containing protein [bacterium]
GHRAGDEVLQWLANLIKTELRGPDIFGRYGGEEFLILLPETTREQAHATAERLRVLIADESNKRFPQMKKNEEDPAITCSFGVADMNTNPATFTDLVQFVDQALYASKADGRNRVTDANIITAGHAYA